MQVKLLRHTPEPEKTVAMSARLCYSPIGAAQLEEKISDEQAAALVRKLVSMGHFSTLEHVTFTFAIEGVSRVLTLKSITLKPSCRRASPQGRKPKRSLRH